MQGKDPFNCYVALEALKNKEAMSVADGMVNLAISPFDLSQAEEAEGLLRQAVRLHEERPQDEVIILHSKLYLAKIRGRQGRYEESEKMHREILRLRRSLLGPEHPHTLIAMESLVEVLNVQKGMQRVRR
jgi:tetratricopeptide (TPR) repeat protein